MTRLNFEIKNWLNFFGWAIFYFKNKNWLKWICPQPNIGKHEHNRRNKLILEIGLSKGFAPTRLIISIFHRLIGQYFESGILFISLANLHGGKRWLDVWERRRQAPLYSNQSPRWVYSAYFDLAYLYFSILSCIWVAKRTMDSLGKFFLENFPSPTSYVIFRLSVYCGFMAIFNSILSVIENTNLIVFNQIVFRISYWKSI